MTYINANPCKNLNHGRSSVSIGYCPECGKRFNSAATGRCDTQKHADYRKQRFVFCIDCGKKV